MARWSVVASPLTICPLPPSRFRPRAPYCPQSWHLTAKNCSPGRHPTAPPPLAGTLLLRTGWHPTAHLPGGHPLCSVAPLALLPLRSFRPSSVTPSRGIALPPWLCPTLGNDVMTCTTVHHGYGGPSTYEFSRVGDHRSTPPGPERALGQPSFLLFWGAC